MTKVQSLIATLAILAPMSAVAATYTVPGTVTLSSGKVEPVPGTVLADYPAVGSMGTITYSLDGADSDLLPAWGYTMEVGANVQVGAWSAAITQEAGLGMYVESLFGNSDFMGFGTPGIGAGDPDETLAGSIRWNFKTPVASVPSTFGELRAEIESGNAMAYFSFNGTINGEFVEFAISETPAAVPLPGGSVLLLSGLAAMAAARRRNAS